MLAFIHLWPWKYLWQYSVPKATLPTFHAAMLIPWYTVALRQRAIFHYSMLLPQGNSCILTSFHYLMSNWIALNYKKKGGERGFKVVSWRSLKVLHHTKGCIVAMWQAKNGFVAWGQHGTIEGWLRMLKWKDNVSKVLILSIKYTLPKVWDTLKWSGVRFLDIINISYYSMALQQAVAKTITEPELLEE